MSGQPVAQAALAPANAPTTYRIGRCVGPGAGLEIFDDKEFLPP